MAKKKNEETIETMPNNAVAANTGIEEATQADIQAILDKQKKDSEEAEKVVVEKKEVEVVTPITDTPSDEPKFDEEGNIIQEAVNTSVTTPITNSSLAKLLKAEYSDDFDDLEETADDKAALAYIKKIKDEKVFISEALRSEEEFNNSDDAKYMMQFLGKSNEERYKDYLIATKIQENYSEEFAKRFAEKQIEKAKSDVDDGEDDIVEIEGNRLANMVLANYNNKKQEFQKKRQEALKLNITNSKPKVDIVKEVKNILAASDTFLGIKFTKEANKQKYVENATKLIDSGEIPKMLSNPNEIAEFLVWKANKAAYDDKLRNEGRNLEKFSRPSSPTSVVLGSSQSSTAQYANTTQQNGNEKKFNPSAW